MSLAPLRRVSTLLAAPRPSALAAYPVRALHAHTPAKASVSNARLSDVVEVTASGTSPAQRARSSSLSPEERKKEVQRRAEEKHRRYEARMKAKAKEEGLSSIEELRSKRLAERQNTLAQSSDHSPPAQSDAPQSSVQERDSKLAAEIRKRAQAEAKRKLERGEVTGGTGRNPIKPLSEIIDITRLAVESPENISRLWTGYHTFKNKLSAVIPAQSYMEMIRTARRYPQFVLPLPRDIVGEDADTANVAPGEKKTGFEMQFMEWGFLPPPKPAQPSVSSSDTGAPTSMPNGGAQPERDAIPSTVLFTPLAEYKLRQEYAQPLLVLTHYTDLIASKGIVLMRGEITGADEVDAAPTGIVAAAAAAKAGASEEEQQRLAQPVKSQGRMSQQDAQLLSMCMQRFYLPKLGSADSSRRNETDTGAQERADLLASFHENPTKFDVDQLVAAAYQF